MLDSIARTIHNFIKYVESCDVFACDFIDDVKVCQSKLYILYCDPFIKFDDHAFGKFHPIESFSSLDMHLVCFPNTDGGEEAYYLAMQFGSMKA